MDVDTVGDQAAPKPAVVERRADEARRPMAELRHRIEQMSDATRPRLGRRHRGLVGGVAVAETDADPAIDEPADLPRRRGLSRDRQQQRADPRIEQGVDIGIGHGHDERRVVGALPGPRQERPFEVDPEDAGRLRGERLAHRRDRFGAAPRPVGDEGRQAPGRAVGRVSGRDARGAGCRRGLVEQHAAAAVDLGVEEARRERAASEIPSRQVGGQRGRRHYIGDAGAVEQHPMGVEEALARENPGADEGVHPHQIVSVTLRSRLGRSGSQPRARETRSASA